MKNNKKIIKNYEQNQQLKKIIEDIEIFDLENIILILKKYLKNNCKIETTNSTVWNCLELFEKEAKQYLKYWKEIEKNNK